MTPHSHPLRAQADTPTNTQANSRRHAKACGCPHGDHPARKRRMGLTHVARVDVLALAAWGVGVPAAAKGAASGRAQASARPRMIEGSHAIRPNQLTSLALDGIFFLI